MTEERRSSRVWFVTCFDDNWAHDSQEFLKPTGPGGEPNYSKHQHARTFGFFFDEKQAKYHVKNNISDLHERLYTYAVVEGLLPGLYAGLSTSNPMTWYHWEDHMNQWVETERPWWTERTINFSIG